jgi:hypothetical protein
MSESDESICPVCGIKRIDGNFVWSYSGRYATPDELYNKACGWGIKQGKTGCINPSGRRVKGLGWGESMTERSILQDSPFGEDLKFRSLEESLND